MAETSKISWTDSTANFWEGCTKVSAGCANCYAEARDKRFTGGQHWGKGAPRRKSKSAVKDCLRWNKTPWVCECGLAFAKPHADTASKCPACGEAMHRRRVFSLSLGDWLDPEVPIEWLAEMLDTIRRCDQLRFILCTKRPEFWGQLFDVLWRLDGKFHLEENRRWVEEWFNGNAPHNVTLLTSVENQEAADLRIPQLLKIPAVCRGLSLEPLLGPVDLSKWIHWDHTKDEDGIKDSTCESELNWLVCGGESGPNARPCNIDWVRSLVQQGRTAGVAVHVKQLGSNPVATISPAANLPCGIITHPKGGDPDEWPADLRVREWPEELR